MSEISLYHIAGSNFSEKARFALQYKQLRYRDRVLPPGPHLPVVLLLSGQRQVPVLTIGKRVIPDSTDIIAALEAHQPSPALYPEDAEERAEALEWEDDLDLRWGPSARLLVIEALLESPDKMAALLGPWARSFPPLWDPILPPVVRFFLRQKLDGSAIARAREDFDATLTKVEERLEQHDYLVGNRFSVADLTFAALGSTLAVPERYFSALPKRLESLVIELADREAIRWTRDLYARHRRYRASQA